MVQTLKILGCGVVYFLVVYLFVIRRESRPILPWIVCILAQVIGTVFFFDIKEWFLTFLPAEQYGSLAMVIPSAVLCFGNLALIFFMFGKVLNNINEKNAEVVETRQDFRIAPLPPSFSAGAENVSASDGETDITIDFIRKMIADGRREEALKYLKMFAYYGKDDASRAEAKKLIDELNTAEG